MNTTENSDEKEQTRQEYTYILIKLIIFLIVWVFITILFMTTVPSKTIEMVVPLEDNKVFIIPMDEDKPTGNVVRVQVKGNIDEAKTYHPNLALANDPNVIVNLEFYDKKDDSIIWKSKDWIIYYDNSISKVEHNFNLKTYDIELHDNDDIKSRVKFLNQHGMTDGVSIKIMPNPCDTTKGVWLGIFLLVFLYILIIFEITDRTFAALFTSLFGVAIMSALHERVLVEEIIEWMNVSAIMLIFGMMIMVGILTDTGFFDYMAVVAFKWSGGRTWHLLFFLCLFTTLCSVFLINVTVILLMGPTTIRISEIMGLDTRSVLIIIVIFANIGGALTPVSDYPNILITTHPFMSSHGVNYGVFTIHMFPGVFLSFIVAFTLIYYMLRNRIESEKRPLQKLFEDLEKQQKKKKLRRLLRYRIAEIQNLAKMEAESQGSREEHFEKNLAELKKKYKIRNPWLLTKCAIAFIFFKLISIMHSMPVMGGASLEWAAILAAWLLIIMDNRRNFESILERIDWATLIFFASLFVLMEVLEKLGFLEFWSDLMLSAVKSANPKHRMNISLVLLIWVVAVFSAVINNIATTVVFLKVSIHMALSIIEVSLTPLVWSLMFGAAFGANGTLLGASSNLVMSGLASLYGYRIHIKHFTVIGLPVMLATVTVATLYLIIAHSVFSWHEVPSAFEEDKTYNPIFANYYDDNI